MEGEESERRPLEQLVTDAPLFEGIINEALWRA